MATPPPTAANKAMIAELDALIRYVPGCVIDRYVTDPSPISSGPEYETFIASTGFFDVSGFSKLGDKLERQQKKTDRAAKTRLTKMGTSRHMAAAKTPVSPVGKSSGGFDTTAHASAGKGAEDLTTKLNFTLGGVIDTITRFGGDITKFAGDAMLVIWRLRTAQDDLGVLASRSALCALAAIRECDERNAARCGAGEEPLGMHIGLGASQIWGAHVGGLRRRFEFFITGEGCAQMHAAEGDAGLGQVVASAQHVAAMRASPLCTELQLSAMELPSGNLRIDALSVTAPPCPPAPLATELPPAILRSVRCYVPAPVIASLDAGVTVPVGGLRETTVVFVNLLDLPVGGLHSARDAELFFLRTNYLVREIQDAVYQYEATLRQFIQDDKGSVAIVAVGLPPLFHEDNAARGLKIALRLLARGINASIGVTTGVVYCGSVGSSRRAEYAVVGDTVNLSARLMGKAGANTVLCDAATRSLAGKAASRHRHAFRFEAREPMAVKGKQARVQVYMPSLDGTARDLLSLTDAESDVVGRRDEKALLRAVFRCRNKVAGATGTTTPAVAATLQTAATPLATPPMPPSTAQQFSRMRGTRGLQEGASPLHPRVVLLEAAYGLGKTYLLQHVVSQFTAAAAAAAPAPSFLLLAGMGSMETRSQQLAPWRPVLRALLLEENSAEEGGPLRPLMGGGGGGGGEESGEAATATAAAAGRRRRRSRYGSSSYAEEGSLMEECEDDSEQQQRRQQQQRIRSREVSRAAMNRFRSSIATAAPASANDSGGGDSGGGASGVAETKSVVAPSAAAAAVAAAAPDDTANTNPAAGDAATATAAAEASAESGVVILALPGTQQSPAKGGAGGGGGPVPSSSSTSVPKARPRTNSRGGPASLVRTVSANSTATDATITAVPATAPSAATSTTATATTTATTTATPAAAPRRSTSPGRSATARRGSTVGLTFRSMALAARMAQQSRRSALTLGAGAAAAAAGMGLPPVSPPRHSHMHIDGEAAAAAAAAAAVSGIPPPSLSPAVGASRKWRSLQDRFFESGEGSGGGGGAELADRSVLLRRLLREGAVSRRLVDVAAYVIPNAQAFSPGAGASSQAAGGGGGLNAAGNPLDGGGDGGGGGRAMTFLELTRAESHASDVAALFIALFRAVMAVRPGVALFLDDAHLMDPPSWRLLHRITRALPLLHVFVAYRPVSAVGQYVRQFTVVPHSTVAGGTVMFSAAAAAVGSGGGAASAVDAGPVGGLGSDGKPRAYMLRPQPFTRKQTAELLHVRLQVMVANDELLAFVHSRSRGVPPSVLELVEDLVEKDYVTIDVTTGEAKVVQELSGVDSSHVSHHFRAAVIRRFDALGTAPLSVLKLASVVGRTVPVGMLRRLFHWFFLDSSSSGNGGRGDGDMCLEFGPGSGARGEPNVPLTRHLETLIDSQFLRQPMSGLRRSSSDLRRQAAEAEAEAEEAAAAAAAAVALLSATPAGGGGGGGQGGGRVRASRAGSVARVEADVSLVNFVSEDVRFIVYHMVLHSDRKKIHRAVLRWFEEEYPEVEARRNHFAELGFHCLCIDALPRAAFYFEHAVEEALLRDRMGDARGYLKNCSDLLPSFQVLSADALNTRMVRVDMLFGQFYMQRQQWEMAALHLQNAVDASGCRQIHRRAAGTLRGRLCRLLPCVPPPAPSDLYREAMGEAPTGDAAECFLFGSQSLELLRAVHRHQADMKARTLKLQALNKRKIRQNRVAVAMHTASGDASAATAAPGQQSPKRAPPATAKQAW